MLTDVIVTDAQGNPVQGLDRSAFRVYEDGKPQVIASFAEHTGAEVAPAAATSTPGVFSNAFLQHPPPAFDVLLLDVTTLRIEDQMYLAEQLSKFLASLPADRLLAVYLCAGESVVLLQDFTTDRGLLRSALYKSIPHLQAPGSAYASELSTLIQMVNYLRPYPGRKNLIWFSGGSNMALMADASHLPPMVNMRPIYDALEAGRIAVYPVDGRGLTVGGGMAQGFQHLMMGDTAEATGGRAFYNNNGLREIATKIVNSGEDFYTLTYSPHEAKYDNKWRKVKVEVEDGKYQLSYRRGYYDDGSRDAPRSGDGRRVLLADNTAAVRRPDPLQPPIVFSASVQPWGTEVTGAATPVAAGLAVRAPKKHEVAYDVHYTLPAADFAALSKDGRERVRLGTAVLGINRVGSHVAQEVQNLSVGLNAEALRAHPEGVIAFDERVNLPQGDAFLYLLVWDLTTGRYGMVQAPVTVAKSNK